MEYQLIFSQDSREYGPHTHACYEILYIISGEIEISVEGRRITARSADAVFLNQLEQHSTRVLKAPYVRYFLLLPTRATDQEVGDNRLLSVFKRHSPAFPYAIHAPGLAEYFRILEKIPQDFYAAERAMALVRLVLMDTFALYPAAFDGGNKEPLLPISNIQAEIDHSISDPFSLSALARRYHVSTSCLSRHFKECVGLSPLQYVTRSRLVFARALLAESSLPVGTVAVRCGFGDVSNFIRRFRQQYGQTPLKYRSASHTRKASGDSMETLKTTTIV